jgi:hypothetical protein
VDNSKKPKKLDSFKLQNSRVQRTPRPPLREGEKLPVWPGARGRDSNLNAGLPKPALDGAFPVPVLDGHLRIVQGGHIVQVGQPVHRIPPTSLLHTVQVVQVLHWPVMARVEGPTDSCSAPIALIHPTIAFMDSPKRSTSDFVGAGDGIGTSGCFGGS